MAKAKLIASVVLLLCIIDLSQGAYGSGGGGRVLLEDLKTLTLYNGKMTSGRRSSPVNQLKCIGGTAGCTSYVPQVVQCYNRGSDGYDIQWECKTDMDNEYRLGKIEVLCEGFDYPDDPYILAGSCGLEYTLDLTKEGNQNKQHGGGGQHNYYGKNDQGHHDSYPKKGASGYGNLITLAIVCVIGYAIYTTCIANANTARREDGRPDPPSYDDATRRDGRRPPPPGFRQDYMPGNDDDGPSCSSTRSNTHTGTAGAGPATGGGGFWSGAATGGILGYLFGSRTGTQNQYYQRPGGFGGFGGGGYNRGFGGGGFGGGSGWGGGSSGFGGGSRTTTSSGTRTASGFGGTRRR